MFKSNRFMKLSKEGFTLVELMIVVAIIGILSTIAVPQYQKFQAKSRQTEIRIALASAYTVQTAWAADNSSFSSCLGNIGFARDGSRFYYTVGFNAAGAIAPDVNNGCGPDGTMACNSYSWRFDKATNAWANDLQCVVANPNTVSFLANSKDKAAAPAAATDLPPTTSITSSTFIIGGAGNILGTVFDSWTVNETKVMTNTISGI